MMYPHQRAYTAMVWSEPFCCMCTHGKGERGSLFYVYIYTPKQMSVSSAMLRWCQCFLGVCRHLIVGNPHFTSPRITAGTASTPPSHSPRPHASHPLTPTSPPAGGDEGGWRWEGVETTQDSILEDSGFLPGTPPAKKVGHTHTHTL